MTAQFWKRMLPRGLAATAVLMFILAELLAPLVAWTLLFKVWNGWATYAGRDALIPLNWRTSTR